MPEGVMNLVIGSNEEIGETLIADRRFPLISATGSTRMGRYVAERVASRPVSYTHLTLPTTYGVDN